jgi:hypothetical protein
LAAPLGFFKKRAKRKGAESPKLSTTARGERPMITMLSLGLRITWMARELVNNDQ